MKGINRMNNHNYTIEFVKGDRADIISQFKKMDSYCLLNNLFKVKTIITSKKDYYDGFNEMVSYIGQRKDMTIHIVAPSKASLIQSDEARNKLVTLYKQQRIIVHFLEK